MRDTDGLSELLFRTVPFGPFREESTMKELVKQFAKCESGATAIEYGLIASLMAVAAITAMTNVGNQMVAMLGSVETALTQ